MTLVENEPSGIEKSPCQVLKEEGDVKIEHLKAMLFQKNKKGNYREITIIPRIKHEYRSGGERSSYAPVISRCAHCNIPVAVTRGVSVVSATCSNCRERQRVARLSI